MEREQALCERQRILECLRAQLPQLRQRYGVESVALFGSLARGEARAGSDVDLLVRFREPPGLLGFVALRDELTAMLGRRVDLATPQSLPPSLVARVAREAIAV